MKETPNEMTVIQRQRLLEELSLDDTRDNPTPKQLQKRKEKRKNRQVLLDSLEKKYDFSKTIKNKRQYSFLNKDINKLKRRYIQLCYYKEQLDSINMSNSVDRVHAADSSVQEIYHTIETERMNGYDMYNMIKALQYQLRENKKEKIKRKENNINKIFNQHGGIQLYLDLKNYLTDLGVDLDELHREKL